MVKLCWSTLLAAASVSAQAYLATIAGAPPATSVVPSTGLAASFGTLTGAVTDASGNVYFADTRQQTIFRLEPSGRLFRAVGNGIEAESPDGPALAISLTLSAAPMAVNRAGELIFGDGWRIRKLRRDGLVVTIPRFPSGGYLIDTLAVDPNGAIFYSAAPDNRVYRIGPDNVASLFAGNGEEGSAVLENAPATTVPLFGITALAVSPSGAVYIAEERTRRIRVVGTNGAMRTFAGNGTPVGGDGGLATVAGLGVLRSLAVHPNGDLFLASFDGRIRRIRSSGIIEQFLYAGNWSVAGIAFDSTGNLFLADPSARLIRRTDGAQITTTVAGGAPSPVYAAPPAAVASIGVPYCVAVSPSGAVTFLTDRLSPVLRQIGADGRLRTLPLARPSDLAFAAQFAFSQTGELFVAHNDRISRLTPDGQLVLVAGGLGAGSAAAGLPALRTPINAAFGLAFSPAGELHYADGAADTIRKIDSLGIVRDIPIPVAERPREPRQLAFDPLGNLYFADTRNHRVRRVGPGGLVATVAGSGQTAPFADQIEGPRATVASPVGLAADRAGNLYILEANPPRVRVLRPSGVLSTVTAPSFGAPPAQTPAEFPGVDGVSAIAVDNEGRLILTNELLGSLIAVVRTSPVLELSAPSLVLTSRSPSAVVSVTSSPAGAAVPNALASPGWLSVTQSASTTPAVLHITADPARLPAGRATGSVVLGARSIPVSMDVLESGAPRLDVSRSPILLRASERVALSIRNAGGGVLPFRLSAKGAPWLSVSPSEGQASAAVPGIAILSASGAAPTAIDAAVVQITAEGQTVEVPVTLLSSADAARPRLAASGVAFAALALGPPPAARTLRVAGEGAFSVSASTLSGGEWLRAAAAGRSVVVSVDPSALSPGEYFGEVRLLPASGGAPRVATVALRVWPRGGSTLSPVFAPLALTFAGAAKVTLPSEDILLHNPLHEPVAFSVNAPSWVTVAPGRGLLPPGATGRFTVQVDGDPAQTLRRAAVNVSFSDGSVRALEVLALTNPPGCVSRRLYPQFVALPAERSLFAAQAVPVEVRVTDECGQPAPASASVFVRLSTGEPDIQLTPVDHGLWAGAWNPAHSATPATLSAVAVSGAQTGRVDYPLAAEASPQTPLFRPGAIVHSASQSGDAPMAPGTLVTLYGVNLAAAVGQSPGLPLPSVLEGTQVLAGGVPMPLLFVSPNQINALLPPGLLAGEAYPVAVRRGDRQSAPELLPIAAAQPGIFTANQSGSGQGVVLGPDQLTLADAANPAPKGQAVVIYGTGFGEVTDVGGLSQTQLPVAVTAGGVPARVLFSGLTPGFAGLYQVNAILGETTPSGDAVALTVTVNQRVSNVVSIAVR